METERIATQYHTEIPRVEPVVRRFDVHVGRCVACGTRVQGRHQLQTWDALGAAASQLGPQALSLATHLNKLLGAPFWFNALRNLSNLRPVLAKKVEPAS